MVNIDLQSLARALGGEVSGNQVLAPGPGHSAKDRSLSVKLDTGAPDGFIVNSFAGDDPIKCRDFVREKAGLPAFKPNGGNGNRRRRARTAEINAMMASAVDSVASEPAQGRVVAAYDYRDANGELLYQVVRYEPKRFNQRRPDGKGGWIWSKDDCPRVLYHLSDLLKWPDACVFVCEGEKDADRVASLDHCATAVACGKWTDDCVQTLTGRDVLILEDADKAGRKKALAAATALYGTASTIRIVRLPGLTGEPKSKDVSDWLDFDLSRGAKLADVCFEAPLWTPDTAGEESHKANGKASNGGADTGSPKDGEIITCRVSDIEPQPIDWLWEGRLARGKLTLIAGDPGLGKSQIDIDLHARLSSAAYWPDGTSRAPIANSIILSAEDAASDTLRPRLEAADADLQRVWILDAVRTKDGKRSFTLQQDLEQLGNKLNEIGDVAMITIDPITSYMGKIDSHRTVDVRGVLEPLASFADKHHVAILAVSHPPKASQAKAIHAVTGSLAFVAAARIVFIVVEEPETGRRLMLPTKNNLAAMPLGLAYRLEQRFVHRTLSGIVNRSPSAPTRHWPKIVNTPKATTPSARPSTSYARRSPMGHDRQRMLRPMPRMLA
jgi:putative DNA primase/helicase